MIATKRAAVLTTLAQELHERAKELGLEVQEPSPETVRQQVTGNPKATKYEVAQRLATTRFPGLTGKVPMKSKTPALWLTSRERYWLHTFDALSLCIGADA